MANQLARTHVRHINCLVYHYPFMERTFLSKTIQPFPWVQLKSLPGVSFQRLLVCSFVKLTVTLSSSLYQSLNSVPTGIRGACRGDASKVLRHCKWVLTVGDTVITKFNIRFTFRRHQAWRQKDGKESEISKETVLLIQFLYRLTFWLTGVLHCAIQVNCIMCKTNLHTLFGYYVFCLSCSFQNLTLLYRVSIFTTVKSRNYCLIKKQKTDSLKPK